VAGAGTAGSLLVYNLASRYPTAKILVVDSGKDDVQDNAVIRTPQDGPNPNDPTDDWGQIIRSQSATFGEGAMIIQDNIRSLTTDQFITGTRPITLMRGSTLGGTSAINGLAWNRGTKTGTYDKWEDATGSADFGWAAMNDTFKKLENRSQITRIYGQPVPMWLPHPGPFPPPTDGQGVYFDSRYMGDSGRIHLTQSVLPGYTNRAMKEVLAAGLQPGRTFKIDLDPENPANPTEYHAKLPETNYDQSDPSFSTFNPYPLTTPGLTYTPPLDHGNAKGPEYAGSPSKLGGVGLRKNLWARCFAAPAFMYPVIYNTIPNNVTLKTKCYITGLIFDNLNDPLECTGINYIENGWQVANVARAIRRDVKPWKGTLSEVDRSTCTEEQAKINQSVALAGGIKSAYAKLDVWLCLGTMDSAAMLQRSGIGPKELLNSLSYSPVPVRLDKPGVGNNVQDSCDFAIGVMHEIDFNTYLPVPYPASAQAYIYLNIFGAADPTSYFPPANVGLTSSISGAAVGYGSDERVRWKSKPSLSKFDFDTIPTDTSATSVVFGNTLWQDTYNYSSNLPSNVDFNSNYSPSVYDRSSLGFYTMNGYTAGINTSSWISEYWDDQSKGQVVITSNSPFDRPNYAPNMLANENDIEAFENHFQNNLMPLFSKMNQKRVGPRGPATFTGLLAIGGFVNTTTNIQLGSNVTHVFAGVGPIPFGSCLSKPFAASSRISQASYDTAGSMIGSVVTIATGLAAGQSAVVTGWSGNTGVPATSYVADISTTPLSIVPAPGDIYTAIRGTETPIDSCEFDTTEGDTSGPVLTNVPGENRRNFVRLMPGVSERVFADIGTQTLGANPITTYEKSTRITINTSPTPHGFDVGEYILISGVTAPIDTITADNFNNYHVVDKVNSPTSFDIVLYWNKTAIPGTAGSPQTPSPAESAIGIVGTGNTGIVLHTLKFNKLGFRDVLYALHFSGWHASSSCRMGLADNDLSVVDIRARVYNTLGLRVCDASILPVKPDSNIVAPTYALTQRLFDLVSSEEYDSYL